MEVKFGDRYYKNVIGVASHGGPHHRRIQHWLDTGGHIAGCWCVDRRGAPREARVHIGAFLRTAPLATHLDPPV